MVSESSRRAIDTAKIEDAGRERHDHETEDNDPLLHPDFSHDVSMQHDDEAGI
jgi:hypothetical protein